ncbi:5-(carboxyamino)imidazole ribonucleotide mutase [Helicobacter pametensis]|uniref:5-(carboxyamino)imidazole ribonucleotide mutase n=1 Tax=Helicobacter pametensis TaxID=95149 RepID=UPI00048353A9|nr:5-(carboxyamino)imidazole ribonucleotide mutase [Helicobacter pametensis]
MKKIAVVMGSKSDLEIVEKCINILQEFQIDFEVHILSAHRTPEEVKTLATQAEQNDFGVIIAAAGKSAHLAGVIASLTTLPVIALPIKTSDLGGMDSLLSSVQMPSGIPVACVAINGAENAGLLAIEMLAIHDKTLSLKLKEKRQSNAEKILKDNKEINLKYKKEQ